MKGSCREYTLPRSEESSRVGGWIRGNTMIGRVLDVKVCYHGRYGVEMMIESLFRDRTVSWVRIVNGMNKYVTATSEEVPVASVENRGTGKPVAKAKPRPKPALTWVSCVHSLSWTKTDRRWTREIQSRLFWSVKIHDQIVTTWWYSSSRRWWSCKIWRPGRIVQVKVLRVLRNGQLKLGPLSWQKEEDRRKGFSTAWTLILPIISCISEQSKDTQEVLSLILLCKTMHCCRMTSPSTSTTSGTLTTCTPSRVDWFREEEVSKGTNSQCFSQPWTRCTPIKISKKFNTIWTNPESRCTKTLGEFTTIQYIGTIWSSFREEDGSSIKHDPTQSLFSAHYLRFLLRKWFSWRLERI